MLPSFLFFKNYLIQMSQRSYHPRRTITAAIAIIIGLIAGFIIKKITIGLVIGLIFGLVASVLLKKPYK